MHSKVQQLGEVQRTSRQRSIAEVLADVLSNLQDILRSEIQLLSAQAREEFRAFRPAGTLIMVGVLCGFMSAFFVLIAVVAALSLLVSVWLAALLVAIVMAGVCALLLRSGVDLVRSRAEKVAAAPEERTPWTRPPIA